jgi:D-glucosaminate-6-phosphate ammonia-lyase
MMPSVTGAPIASTPVYADLGVRTFINAAGTYTKLGGSRMPPVVVDAMRQAALQFVQIDELQRAVGTRIAAITHNEAAYVTCGAAAGLLLATAACMTGGDPELARQLPDPHGMPRRVVMYRAHRNPYDYAVRTLPIDLVELGFPNQISPPTAGELVAALTEGTAAVLYVLAGWTATGSLPLEEVIALAHQHGVPVIVDAAAQLPPKDNLWCFTSQGADLVIFSGGKDLCGPQASGLIVGRSPLIAACAQLGAPHHGIGRPLKVGKEELVGLHAAVQWYMGRDEAARAQSAEWFVAQLITRLHGHAVHVERSFPNEAGQPLPRALVRFDGSGGAARCAQVVASLRFGQPGVEVGPGEDEASFYVNPMTVEDDEQGLLLDRLDAVLREGAS